ITNNARGKVKIEIVNGDFTKGTAVIKSEFDILCSGNEKVLERGAALGYNTRFIERYGAGLYSGTNERMVLQKDLKTPVAPVFKIARIKVDELKPIELINKRHFSSLESQILEDGAMKEPLIIDSKSMAVLDGSHRYAFCKKYNIEQIDVLVVDYDSDLISVGTRLHHRIEIDSKLWLSKQKVRFTAYSGKLFNPRTTRHFFPFRKPRIDFKLNLDPSNISPIDYLTSDNTTVDELKQNQEYIKEIETELERLNSYISEQQRVKKWLQSQNEYIGKNL
ncbi:ParB N-terminal domain-containing protein, partial [Akkermansiaceae bacterium]|nr:ParB N-terminal domain-containing protein [Akkermansiaceae bacterium]